MSLIKNVRMYITIFFLNFKNIGIIFPSNLCFYYFQFIQIVDKNSLRLINGQARALDAAAAQI